MITCVPMYNCTIYFAVFSRLRLTFVLFSEDLSAGNTHTQTEKQLIILFSPLEFTKV